MATALLIPIEYIPDHLLFTQMTIRAKAFGATSEMLEDLDRRLTSAGVSLVFAELKPGAPQDRTVRADRCDRPRALLSTVTAAVHGYQEQTGAKWGPLHPDPGEQGRSDEMDGCSPRTSLG